MFTVPRDSFVCPITMFEISNPAFMVCDNHLHLFERDALLRWFTTQLQFRCPNCRSDHSDLLIVDFDQIGLDIYFNDNDVDYLEEKATPTPFQVDSFDQYRTELTSLINLANQLVSAETVNNLLNFRPDFTFNIESVAHAFPERAAVADYCSNTTTFINPIVHSGFVNFSGSTALTVRYNNQIFTGRNYRDLRLYFSENLEFLVQLFDIHEGSHLRKIVLRFTSSLTDHTIFRLLSDAGFVVIRHFGSPSMQEGRIIMTCLYITINDEIVDEALLRRVLSR